MKALAEMTRQLRSFGRLPISPMDYIKVDKLRLQVEPIPHNPLLQSLLGRCFWRFPRCYGHLTTGLHMGLLDAADVIGLATSHHEELEEHRLHNEETLWSGLRTHLGKQPRPSTPLDLSYIQDYLAASLSKTCYLAVVLDESLGAPPRQPAVIEAIDREMSFRAGSKRRYFELISPNWLNLEGPGPGPTCYSHEPYYPLCHQPTQISASDPQRLELALISLGHSSELYTDFPSDFTLLVVLTMALNGKYRWLDTDTGLPITAEQAETRPHINRELCWAGSNPTVQREAIELLATFPVFQLAGSWTI